MNTTKCANVVIENFHGTINTYTQCLQVPFTLLTYHLFTCHALLIYYVEEQVSIVGVHLEYFQMFLLLLILQTLKPREPS